MLVSGLSPNYAFALCDGERRQRLVAQEEEEGARGRPEAHNLIIMKEWYANVSRGPSVRGRFRHLSFSAHLPNFRSNSSSSSSLSYSSPLRPPLTYGPGEQREQRGAHQLALCENEMLQAVPSPNETLHTHKKLLTPPLPFALSHPMHVTQNTFWNVETQLLEGE